MRIGQFLLQRLEDDPGVCRRIRDLHQQFPSLPIVIYTSLAAGSTRAILDLGRSGIEHVVLNRFDDERRRFLELIERIPAQSLSDEMLRLLAPELAKLPVTMVRAIEQMFRSPSRFKNAQDLSSAAGTLLRTLYRQLDSAGIHSPRLLVAAARLIRVYALLRDPGTIATANGHGSANSESAAPASSPSPYTINATRAGSCSGFSFGTRGARTSTSSPMW